MSEIAFRPFGMGTFWPMSQHFIVLVTQFHTIFHTFFFTLAFYESVSAQSDSPLA